MEKKNYFHRHKTQNKKIDLYQKTLKQCKFKKKSFLETEKLLRLFAKKENTVCFIDTLYKAIREPMNIPTHTHTLRNKNTKLIMVT